MITLYLQSRGFPTNLLILTQSVLTRRIHLWLLNPPFFEKRHTITTQRRLKAKTITPWILSVLDDFKELQTQKPSSSDMFPRILAIFEHSCYLGYEPNSLFCLGLPTIGKGPLNLLIEPPPEITFNEIGFRKGENVTVGNGFVKIGSCTIVLKNTEIWLPSSISSNPATRLNELRSNLDAIFSMVNFHPVPPGLGLLTKMADQTNCKTLPFPLPPLAGLLFPFIQQLAKGILSADLNLIESGTRGLVGTGPGLTPSGDDFLGAFFTTIRAMGPSVYQTTFLEKTCSLIRQVIVGKTSMISESLLQCALEGASSESIHDLISLSLEKSPSKKQDPLSPAVKKVTGSGHSSGWDSLAGIAWGLKTSEAKIRCQNPYV